LVARKILGNILCCINKPTFTVKALNKKLRLELAVRRGFYVVKTASLWDFLTFLVKRKKSDRFSKKRRFSFKKEQNLKTPS